MDDFMWLVKVAADFFMAFGFLVFFGAMICIVFNAGEVNVSTGWFIIPPLVFAWFRGVLCHWPKELKTKGGDH